MTPPAPPHSTRCAAVLRSHSLQEGWSLVHLAEAIHGHCGHSRLRSHRLARGWTLTRLVTQMGNATEGSAKLTPSRVSRWELHQDSPSSGYRDALCRVYRTGPVELGLCVDFSESPSSEPGVEGRMCEPPLYAPASSSANATPAAKAQMPCRDALTARLEGSGEVLDGPLLQAAYAVRRCMDETLSGSAISDGTVSYWEEVSEQYGRTYKTRPAVPFLVDIVADFAELQRLTDQRLPSGPRRELCVVAGRLAGLVSMIMTNLGRYREARGWAHTARLAADESGDCVLRAWVATRQAVAHLHFADPDGAMAAARQAQLLARNNPCGAAAMAPAIEARAAAALGDFDTARDRLRRAEMTFGRLADQDNGAYAFTLAQLHFYASNALTITGDISAAAQAQREALAAFGPDERLDPTLVHLDRALCLVQGGDIVGGAEYASNLLLGLSAEYRPAIVIKRARAITAAIPQARRRLPAVRDFHDVIALGS